MSTVTQPPLETAARHEWSLADLCDRFGPILYRRIRHDPEPGTATEEDVVRLLEHEDRLYELIDGVLVEKTMGAPEALIASEVLNWLWMHVRPRKLGFVLGSEGMWRLQPGLVRLPDVAFYARDDFPKRKFTRTAMVRVVPRLAVEVLSPSNTRREMDEKLDDYFRAGVKLVWLIDPETRTARVFTARDAMTTLDPSQSLDGGSVLPGFTLRLADLFDEFEDSEPDSAEETPAS